MRLGAILFCVAVVVANPLHAQAQAGSDTAPKITVSGDAIVYVTPDRVEVALGIETRDPDIVAAKQKNNDILKRTLATLRELGVPDKDVQTDHLSIEPRYRDEYQRETFLGYFVRNTLVVTVNDAGKVEDLISRALQAGVNYVHGVSFQTSELRKYRDQARESALKAAKEKAEAMARTLGQAVGVPLQINENYGGAPWSFYSSWSGRSFGGGAAMSQNTVQYAESAPSEANTTIALGKIAVRANVTVSFALR